MLLCIYPNTQNTQHHKCWTMDFGWLWCFDVDSSLVGDVNNREVYACVSLWIGAVWWVGRRKEKNKKENDFCVTQRSPGPYLIIIHQFYYMLSLRVLIPHKPCTIPWVIFSFLKRLPVDITCLFSKQFQKKIFWTLLSNIFYLSCIFSIVISSSFLNLVTNRFHDKCHLQWTIMAIWKTVRRGNLRPILA